MFAQIGISKKQVSLQMVLVFVDKLKLLGFVLFLLVATQAFFIFQPKLGEIRSNLTCAYFSKWIGSTTNSDKVLKVDPFDPLESS